MISILAVGALVFTVVHMQWTKNASPNWSVLISAEGVVFEGDQQPFNRIYVDKKKETYIFASDTDEQLEAKLKEMMEGAQEEVPDAPTEPQ